MLKVISYKSNFKHIAQFSYYVLKLYIVAAGQSGNVTS
jgi:hypothetical protein